MDNTDNMEVYYQSVLLNLEQAVKSSRFESKEALNNYIINMKQNGIPENILSNEKVLELLNIYDEYHQVEESKLDMQNYKGVSSENQNYLLSTENDTILKTDTSNEDLVQEFKETQNKITANSQDGLANAKTVYENLRNNQKEEVSLVSLSEMIERNNIDSELLNKIRFFITNKYINPYSYKVSPETGLFYNIETKEVLEVKKNKETNEYQIYKSDQIAYQEESKSEEISNTNITERDEEEISYKNTLSNPKVRRLIKPQDMNNQAAFVKSSFIIITMISLSIFISSLIVFK